MKKIFQIIALLVLVIQNFAAPMVALAETVEEQVAVNPIALTSVAGKLLNLDKSELLAATPIENNGQYILEVKGNFTKEAPKVENIVLGVSQNFTVKAPTFAVVATDQSSLGQGAVTGNTLNLAIAETVITGNEFVIQVPVEYHGAPELTNDALRLTSTLGDSSVDFAVAVPEAVEVAPEPEVAEEVETVEEEVEATPVAKEDVLDKKLLATKDNKGPIRIEDKIIDAATVTVNPNNPATLESTITFDMKWSFPKGLQETVNSGDYYEFQLPPELSIAREIKGEPIVAEGGRIIGHTFIDLKGKVKFVFTDEVETGDNPAGGLRFTSFINKEIVTTPKDIKITIPVKEKDVEETIKLRPNVEESLSKKGRLDRNQSPNKIDWDVFVNRSMTDLEDIVITDALPTGLTLTDVEVYEIKVDFDGNVVDNSFKKLAAGSDFTIDLNTGIVKLPGKTNKAYRVVYKTKIADDIKLKEEHTFKNNVTQTSTGGNTLPAHSLITVKYGKMLEKELVESNNNYWGREFSWTIRYNYGERSIPADKAWVNDNLPSELILTKEISVKKVTFDEAGNPIVGKSLEYGKDYSIDKTDNDFKINFLKGIDHAVEINYNTKIKDGVILSDAELKLKNIASTEGVKDSVGTVPVHAMNLSKRVDYLSDNTQAINYDDETVAWKIRVNTDKYLMSNWKLTDEFTNKGLALLPATLKIKGSSSEEPLKEGIDYKLTLTKDGFSIELMGAYVKTKEEFVITYTTSFDRNDLTTGSGGRFVNGAMATWTDENNKEHEDTSSDGFVPIEEVLKNGAKSGVYNAVTKEIEWTVTSNFNRDELAAGKIVDPITGNQQYKEGSAVLESYRVDSKGVIVDLVRIDPIDLNVIVDTNGHQTLEVNLPKNIKLGYRLKFKTELKGQIIEHQDNYTNTATVYDGNEQKDSLTAGVSIKNGGKHITKTGVVDNPKDSTKVTWTITANPSQSKLEDYLIIDRPSKNQMIEEDTIVIKKMKSDEAGNLTAIEEQLIKDTDYKVGVSRDEETGQQIMKIKFLIEINDAYEVKYDSTLLLASSDQQVSNRVEMSAKNNKVIHDVAVSEQEVVYNDFSSEGEIYHTDFYLKKVSVGEEGTKSLAGVKLKITKANREKITVTKETDDQGMIEVKGLTTGKYIIKELATPAGHFVSEYANGKEVMITKEHADPEKAFEVVNALSRVELKKVDQNGQTLQGAKFKLSYKNNKGQFIPDPLRGNLVSKEGGLVTIEGLVAGDYLLEEDTAPTGYSRNTTPIKFTLTGNETETIKLADFVNYQGSVSLIKKDTAGNPLSGAEFTLSMPGNPDFKEVKKISGADGSVGFDGLAPGYYTIIETKAPSGYILDKSPRSFDISATATEKPVIDLGEVINYQGSAELTKYSEAGTKTPLAGAEFQVFDKETKKAVLAEALISGGDGKVLATGLAPGDYYFQETKAPEGYILNTKKYDFEIKAERNKDTALVDAGTAINYQGSAQFIKQDDQGDGLAGAEFKVIDVDGKPVKENLTSDDKGLVTVTGLAPGEYAFVETKAPTGFVINTDELGFTIPETSEGKQVLVLEQGLVNFKGSAQLVKKDEADQPIKGATFKVVDEDNKQVGKEVVSDEAGLVTVTGLAPGKYAFIETKPAKGFILNDTARPFEIKENHAGKVDVSAGELINYSGSVNLEKKSATTTKGLANVSFDLFNSKEEKINTYKTDENGKLSVTNLESGSYYFLEVAAPTGYITNTERISFEIAKTATEKVKPVEVKATNYQGSAELIKVDTSDKGLAGASFKLLDADGKEVRSDLTTKKGGKILVENLAPGTYTFIETQAPTGYILNTQKIEFTIKDKFEGKPEVISAGKLINYQGSASLTKTDSENQPLENAVFKVVKFVNGKEEETRTDLKTGSDGRVVVTDLAPGKYAFIETTAPKGYVINSTPKKFEISAQSEGKPELVSTSTLVNFKGEAQLIKTDEDGKTLAGATFKVVNKDNKSVAENLVSNHNGVVTVTGLVAGEYAFIETKAAPGFMLNKTKKTFVIQASYEGKPTIELAGELKNYRGNVTLRKESEASNPLQKASFKLYTISNDYIGTYETDIKGEIVINKLAPGNYYFEETEAPSGFIKNTDKINFEIENEATETPTMVNVKAINYQGSARLIKVGEDDKALAGATFKVVNQADQDIKEGLISQANGEVIAENLAPGIYYFVETKAAPGHVLNKEKAVFTIVSEDSGKPTMALAGNFKNYQGKAELFKTDAKGNPLAGAVFRLVDEKGKTLQENLTTDKSGRIEVTKLAPGSYRLIETQAPVGYMLNQTPSKFTIDQTSDGQTIIVKAETVINYRGSVTLKKVNGSNEVLADAKFILYDDLDKEVATATTDKTGQVTVKDLQPGDYYFKEIEAPKGYILDTEEIRFTITDKATEVPTAKLVTSTNYQGSAELVKVDENGEALAGATFKVMTKAGEEVQTGLTSSVDGKVEVKNLVPGDYYFEETEAASGYILNQKQVPFTIAAKVAGVPETVMSNKAGKLSLTNYTGSVEFKKVSEGGQALAGAIFRLTKEEDTTFKQEVTSDKAGRVRVDGLAPGNYTFEELMPNSGYMKNLETLKFEISARADGKPEVKKLKDFINYQGEIVFRKINGDIGQARELTLDPTIKTGLKGARFSLTPIESDAATLANSPQTKEEIYIADENGIVHIQHLAPGQYILKELEAPDDFIIRTKEYKFVIPTAHAGNPGNTFENQYNDVTFSNYQGTAELTKTDGQDNPLAGAVFNVVDADGTIIRKNLPSDKAGKVFAAGLAPGTYFFKEIQAPTGFVVNDTMVEFTIAAQTETGRSDITGLKLQNYQGSAELVKVDETGKALAGATFKVMTEAGKEVKTGLTSSTDGKVLVENLAPGTYYFEETEAPKGYVRNQEKVSFVIAAEAAGVPETVTSNQAGKLSMTNYQGSVTLTKVEHKNPLKKLANATFNLVDSNGKVIKKKLVTDKNGQINVANLAPGTYYFVEKSAPKGYDLDKTPVKAEIKAAATGKPTVVMVTKDNKLTPAKPQIPVKPVTPTQPNKPTTPSQPYKPDLPYTGTPVKEGLPANKQFLPLTSSQGNFGLIAVGGGLVSLVVYVKRRKQVKS